MNNIVQEGPKINEAYDASTASAHKYFNKVREWVAQQSESLDSLDQQAQQYGDEALAFRIMLKFIESENIILNLNEKVTLTLINPVYKETGRMQKREEHPHGENSLRNKISTINYFESINPNFKGRVFVVDDECPEGSGIMAEEVIAEYPNSGDKVFFLSKAIDENDPDLPPGLTHKDGANRSVKGGALLFGMRKGLNYAVDGMHIIVDNDADLSIHPMQLGLLIKDIVDGQSKAVAGSRREDNSVALIGGSRNKRGSLFISIWQHFLPQLALRVTDTNRAFKAFESSALEKILPSIKVYTFPYQIELLQACISMDVPMIKKGIAYIDSEAASTQSGDNITETYLNQIHQIIDIAKRYNTIEKTDPLLEYLSSISEEEWRKIEVDPSKEFLAMINNHS